MLFCLAAGIWSDRAVSLNAAEYTDEQVKAAFLISFESFVEWPTNRFSQPNAPLVIGVVGNKGVAAELERLRARERSPSSRKVVIRRLTPASDLSECHILFIGRDSDFAPILANLKTKGILTVGEQDQFAQRGGVFNFVLDKDTVKFQVNRRAAAESGLQVSAKLLDVVRTWKLLD